MSVAAEAEAISNRPVGVQSSEYNFTGKAVTVVFDDVTVSIEDLLKTFKTFLWWKSRWSLNKID
jgi:hypothetical protein